MNKAGLLRSIAETAYNVGFGSKKTFATFDIVEKGPGWIGLLSFVVGLFGLIYESLADKVPSALLLTAGVAALYISCYKSKDYEEAGIKLTQLYNRLRDLYRHVEGGGDIAAAESELSRIESEYYSVAVSKQIFLSDWYAHYKFFAQAQTGWIVQELNLRWWQDKIPLSAKIIAVLSVIVLIVYAVALATGHIGLACAASPIESAKTASVSIGSR